MEVSGAGAGGDAVASDETSLDTDDGAGAGHPAPGSLLLPDFLEMGPGTARRFYANPAAD